MIGNRIKLLRLEKGNTQKQLSEYLGLTPKMISFYEKEERFPPHDIILKLADYFNVTTDYLLGRTDEKRPKKERFQDVDTIAAHRIGNIKQLSDEGLEELDNYIELLKLKYKK